MPGLRGTDHIGFTVPDLAQAVDFFVNVIGCEKFYDLGPFKAEDGWMQVVAALDHEMKQLRSCAAATARSSSCSNTKRPTRTCGNRATATWVAITLRSTSTISMQLCRI
jgi:hypothetical protein